jgi:hypothetical protein
MSANQCAACGQFFKQNRAPKHRNNKIRTIPLDRIDVLNPRERNKRVFDDTCSSQSGQYRTLALKLGSVRA